MLVMYKGWGYWEYDSDELNIVVREDEQYMDSCLFKLPKGAEKEVTYLGEAIVSYLLPSKDSDIKEPIYMYPSTDDEPRFVLCDDEPKFDEGCYQLPREQKKVKYTRDVIIENSSNYFKNNSEQQMIDVVNVPTKTKPNSRDRRPAQIKLLLSVIDELKYERLSIPVGGKQKALNKCLKNSKIFSSESVFNRVWSELSEKDQISIKGKEKFLSNQ